MILFETPVVFESVASSLLGGGPGLATTLVLSQTLPAVVTPVEGVDTREDQIEALCVLSAGNTLIIVPLGGVLALQVNETAFVLWRAERRSHDSLSFFTGLVTRTRGPGGHWNLRQRKRRKKNW